MDKISNENTHRRDKLNVFLVKIMMFFSLAIYITETDCELDCSKYI